MKVLLLGKNGFIGSQLIKSILLNNVIVYSIESIEDIYKFLKEDFTIINCAGAANVSESISNPENDYRKNVELVREILEAIRLSENNKIKFINLSSAAVYGNPKSLPVLENALLAPLSPYGYHKMMAENLCKEYFHCFGIKTLSLRIFSAFGEGQKKMLLWDLHKKIVTSDGEIELFGSGAESRDYIHVHDLAQQILLAIKYAKFEGEAINCANGNEILIKNVVELFAQEHPVSFRYSFNDKIRQGDPLNWCADISIMREWGYTQTVDFKEGLKGYIEWAQCQNVNV